MNINNAKSNFGISATASPSRPGSRGSITIGSNSSKNYTDSDQVYQTQMILAGAATAANINLATGAASGDAWVAPVRQVETLTVQGGPITTAGNATVTITAAGLVGSPLAISVSLSLNDTATQAAAKVRTSVKANSAVSDLFDVSGSGDDLILTRKAMATYTLGSETVNMAYANDGTLNIAIADDTCVGLTAVPTSSDTAAGVVGDGAYIVNNDVDFEGVALDSVTDVYALLIQHTSTDDNGQTVDYTIGTEYSGRTTASTSAGSTVLLDNPDTTSILDSLSFLGASDTGKITVTAINKI